MIIIIGIALFISIIICICLGGADIGKDKLEIGKLLVEDDLEEKVGE